MWFSLAHQFLPSCCYYCAITKDRVRLDRFLCLNRKCRQANQIAETVCVFVVKTPLWLWTQGLKHTSFRHTASYELLTPLGNVAQGIGTAERADRATCSWMCWINIFDSKAASVEGVVVTLYLFIALKITPEHNVHRKMPPYTACRNFLIVRTIICNNAREVLYGIGCVILLNHACITYIWKRIYYHLCYIRM